MGSPKAYPHTFHKGLLFDKVSLFHPPEKKISEPRVERSNLGDCGDPPDSLTHDFEAFNFGVLQRNRRLFFSCKVEKVASTRWSPKHQAFLCQDWQADKPQVTHTHFHPFSVGLAWQATALLPAGLYDGSYNIRVLPAQDTTVRLLPSGQKKGQATFGYLLKTLGKEIVLLSRSQAKEKRLELYQSE